MVKVTVLSGFLGSGKTTLLKYILQNAEGLKVAVMVNDMGEINIDADMVKKLGHKLSGTNQRDEHLVELTNGCICCTLRDDMVRELSILAKEKDITHIVIESTGIAEPLPVAAGFTFGVSVEGSNEQKPLSEIAELDTMVTVVDLASFKTYLAMDEKASDRWEKKSKPAEESDPTNCGAPEAERGVAELLCDQVEFANTIILNKTDQVSKQEITEVTSIVKALNSDAKVITSDHCKVPLSEVLSTGRFSFDSAMQHASWAKELNADNTHVPETLEYNLSSFVYIRQMPFHPVRLHELLTSRDLFSKHNVLRAKGFLWVPNESDQMCHMSNAGACWNIDTEGEWYCNLSAERFKEEMQGIGMSEEEFKKAHPKWSDARHGDRRQEIVIIGQGLQKDTIESLLDKALVTEEEFNKGELWLTELPDVFDLGFLHEEIEVEEDEEEEEEEEEEEKIPCGHSHAHGACGSSGKRPLENGEAAIQLKRRK